MKLLQTDIFEKISKNQIKLYTKEYNKINYRYNYNYKHISHNMFMRLIACILYEMQYNIYIMYNIRYYCKLYIAF